MVYCVYLGACDESDGGDSDEDDVTEEEQQQYVALIQQSRSGLQLTCLYGSLLFKVLWLVAIILCKYANRVVLLFISLQACPK